MFVCCIAAVASTPVQKTSKEDRDRLVIIAHTLETDPFNKDAKKWREWGMFFVIQAPDIHVDLCSNLFVNLLGPKKTNESDLTGHEIIAMGAFVIEHADKASDKVAVNQAGVEGVLRKYESILKTKPKSKNDSLDALIVKRDKGELNAYVGEIVNSKCK
jgi:hypothetical protein